MDAPPSKWIGFSELREMNAAWRSVLSLGTRRVYPKGAILEWKAELSFLDAGRIRLTHCSAEGSEKVLWYISSGCIFGETPFFDPREPQGFPSCATESVIYAFSRDCLFNVIYPSRPDLIVNLLSSMAHKLRVMSGQAASLFLDDVPIRICKFLAQRILPDTSPPVASPGISRQEMASLLGVNRIHLYRVLKQQEDAGLIGPFHKDGVIIFDEVRFMRLAQS